jgi:hypothetical protein
MLPEVLVTKLGEAVTASGRPVLVVLDTLEVLRGRGETHPASLFAWLDQLLDRGVRPMSVLAAGRGDALDGLGLIDGGADPKDPADGRIPRVKRLPLGGLDETVAKVLLGKLSAPQPCGQVARTGEQPSAEAAPGRRNRQANWAGSLPRGGAGRKSMPPLYRFLLSRIEPSSAWPIG